MNKRLLEKASILGKTTLLVLMLLFATTFSNAQNSITFAQYLERNGGQDYVFTNNTTSATFQTVSGGSPIYFFYQNITGLPTELQGLQLAHVFVTANTTSAASTVVANGTTRDVQNFDGTFTIQIIRDASASVGTGSGSRTNLLTATISPLVTSEAGLSGNDASNAAGFSASSSSQTVTYTSDFLNFSPTTARDLGLTFTSIQPSFAISGLFLSNFTSAGTGSFASTPAPTYSAPTAGSVSVSGRVTAPNGRGIPNARVTLTYASGTTLIARTNYFGFYRFSDVTAGETVVISVSSKTYQFDPQVLNLNEETNGLNFTAH